MPNINHSKIDTWQTCQMRYKLEYVDSVPETPQPALILGRAVHKVIDTDNMHKKFSNGYFPLEKLLSGGRETLQEELYKVDPTGRLGAGTDSDLRHRSDALLTAYYAEVQGKYTPLESERSFKFRLPGDFGIPIVESARQANIPPTAEELQGWSFSGRIDGLMLDADGNKVIVDYKTAKRPWPAGEEHTLDQATAYLWAAQVLAFDAQRVVFIPLALQQEAWSSPFAGPTTSRRLIATAEFRTTERTPEQILSYIHSVQEVIHQISQATNSSDYMPNPGSHCRWCSVRDRCAYRRY